MTKSAMKSIFISAGHSHTDHGASGSGVREADIVLEFRDLLANALEARGVPFRRDGREGENLPLSQAVKMAAEADIAIEFHCNAFSNSSASGVETLSGPEHLELGARICEVVSKTLGIRNRGAKGEASGQHSRLAFISRGRGIVVELFFISNPDDVAKYQRRKMTLAEELADLLEEVARA